MPKSIVLLSAGLDSAVNLKCALDDGGVTTALTFDYKQRARQCEIENSAAMCGRFGVRHKVISLSWLGDITTTALVNRKDRLPCPKGNLDNIRTTQRSAAKVWVPNRNGIFLAIAAAFAESLRVEQVVVGFNAEEAVTFPDNSEKFVRASNRSLQFSTLSRVHVKSYTARLRKSSILNLGMKIHAPLDLVWCCYEGGERLCGRCESCLRFARAARMSGYVEWFAANHSRLPKNLLKSKSTT